MNRVWSRVRGHEPELGITLAELLVYAALLVLVLPLAGVLLHGALVGNRDVRAVASASAAAQAVAASVEAGVRNASQIRLTATPNATGVPPDELLVVHTQSGGTDASRWTCQAWYYDGTRGTVQTRRVAATGNGASVIAPPDSPTADGWTDLAHGVTAVARPRPAGAPAPNPTPVFTATAATVELGLQIAAGDRTPVLLSTSITQRPQGETASAPCF